MNILVASGTFNNTSVFIFGFNGLQLISPAPPLTGLKWLKHSCGADTTASSLYLRNFLC